MEKINQVTKVNRSPEGSTVDIGVINSNYTGTVTITATVSDSTGWPFKEEKKTEKMKVNPKEREKSKYVNKYR